MPFTSGFESSANLTKHFILHGWEFGAMTEAEYERLADNFLSGPKGTDTLECRRGNGDRLRYNPVTNEFGVLRRDGVIRTYFKPDVAWHRRQTNLDYFFEECTK